MSDLSRKPPRKLRRSAPAPRVLGPPSEPGATCEWCDEPADRRVRLFESYESAAFGLDGGPWDFDMCETCYLIHRKCAAEPDDGKKFFAEWPGREDAGD